jgi:hypothetical protein
MIGAACVKMSPGEARTWPNRNTIDVATKIVSVRPSTTREQDRRERMTRPPGTGTKNGPPSR